MGILEQLIEIKSQEAMEKGLEEGNKKAVKAYLSNTEFFSGEDRFSRRCACFFC